MCLRVDSTWWAVVPTKAHRKACRAGSNIFCVEEFGRCLPAAERLASQMIGVAATTTETDGWKSFYLDRRAREGVQVRHPGNHENETVVCIDKHYKSTTRTKVSSSCVAAGLGGEILSEPFRV
jgi:hypothetical protein